jgi:hypothetical protein
MVRLHFRPFSGPEIVLGPAPWFRISGNYIRKGPDGAVVGMFTRHQWQVQDRHFIRFDCHEPTLIHLEDTAGAPTQDFGPFGSFQCNDGVMYAEQKLLAKFLEETQLWHFFPTENFWPVLVIKQAPR